MERQTHRVKNRKRDREGEREREIYFKELAYAVVGAGKSEIHKAS